MTDPFTTFPDIAARPLGGSVPWANDELFASRDNLITWEESEFQPATFGARGQVYDGWETRRRREDGFDEAIVRLGVPGIVHGVDIDTSHFVGNYPPEASVEAVAIPGYPDVETLLAADWRPLVPRSPIQGDTHNRFHTDAGDGEGERGGGLVTHVRLRIYPDGGVARLRVHGEVLRDPRFLDAGPFDLAALENGGLVVDSSNTFYGDATRLINPGPARTMGEGWETARRRDDSNDWALISLATVGVVNLFELDLTHFVGNAPGSARVMGRDTSGPEGQNAEWHTLLAQTDMLPGVRHRLLATNEVPATELRLDIYPDGGMARLRAWGAPTAAGRASLGRRFLASLPEPMAATVVAETIGVSTAEATALIAGRPWSGDDDAIPEALRPIVLGQHPGVARAAAH